MRQKTVIIGYVAFVVLVALGGFSLFAPVSATHACNAQHPSGSCPSGQVCDTSQCGSQGTCVSSCQHNCHFWDQVCKNACETSCKASYPGCGCVSPPPTPTPTPTPSVCGITFPCDTSAGLGCVLNECVPVSCPAIPCSEGYSCVENQCVQNSPQTCPDVQCPEGQECIDHVCVPFVTPTPTPTPTPGCEVNADCPEGQVCVDGTCQTLPGECDNVVCDPGFYCEAGQCVPDVTPGPGLLGEASSDVSDHTDGEGYILWDRLISFEYSPQGYYWHAFNQTLVYVEIEDPARVNISFSNVTGASDGFGSFIPTSPGHYTAILWGTNTIDNPTEPRVLSADKIWIAPLDLIYSWGPGRSSHQPQEVERTRNYIQGTT